MKTDSSRKAEGRLGAAPGSAAAWQPIQTAPKSGQAVLLWWQGCQYPSVGRWSDDGIREGWRCDGDQCVPKNKHNCTHWMPLPEPPGDDARSGDVN